MLDDDMKLQALDDTNILKAIITMEDKMDLEIKNKQSYQAKNVVINGEKYYVAYEPLTDDTGAVYGMAFVGLKKINISTYITNRVQTMIILAGILIIAFTITTIRYVLSIVGALDENVKAVRKMATGDLDIELSAKVKDRADELGEMSSALFDPKSRVIHTQNNYAGFMPSLVR